MAGRAQGAGTSVGEIINARPDEYQTLCMHRGRTRNGGRVLNYETTSEIETAVAGYFDPRRCVVVPNVWWGMDLMHECDLFVLTKSGFAYEVEIKTSSSDLKRDILKRHGHKSKMLKRLYFAIPLKLLEANREYIPAHAGILTVNHRGLVKKEREAKINNDAVPLKPEQQLKLAHLGTMRIWTLKKELRRINDRPA